MAISVKYFEEVTLFEDEPIGRIYLIHNSSNNTYYLIYGSTVSLWSLYTWTGTGSETFTSYSDGFFACLAVSNTSNTDDVKALTGDALNYVNINLNTQTIAAGVHPLSDDEGAMSANYDDGQTITIPAQQYVNWIRAKGWLMYSSTNTLAVLGFNPQVLFNFLSYAFIANFTEVTLTPVDANTVTSSAGQVGSRVRWGTAGSALCGTITIEDPNSTTAGFLDFSHTKGPIIAGIPQSDRVVILKPFSIHALAYVGGTKLFSPEDLHLNIGGISRYGCKKYKKDIAFIGNDNIYLLKGDNSLEPIGTNISKEFFSSESSYTKTQLTSFHLIAFDQREEIWIWSGVDNFVWKWIKGAWFKSDYSYQGDITFIGKEFVPLSTSKWVETPVIFFSGGATVTDNGDGTWNSTVALYYDSQENDMVGEFTSYFTTKDYSVPPEERLFEIRFQAKTAGVAASVNVYYSMDEGTTWSDANAISISNLNALEWYRAGVNKTCESIRFKFETTHPISFGAFQLVLSQRKKETQSLT